MVLENIYRHLEMGETPVVAAEKGGKEVALPVLAATLTTVVVFFPVTFLYGVSKFLFSALALAVVLSLFASYAVAMTVVPLFCAMFIKGPSWQVAGPRANRPWGARFNAWFNRGFQRLLERLRSHRPARAAPAAGHGARADGNLRGQPGAVSAAGRFFLSPNRRRAVHHQPEGAFRNAAGAYRTTGWAKWKTWCAVKFRPGTWA